MKYTTPFLVFPQQEVKRPEQLIAKFAQMLEDKGYVEAGYTESVLDREHMSATTIGVALPSLMAERVKQSCIVVVTLKRPITWGTEKVELVFLLAIKHDERKEMRRLFRNCHGSVSDRHWSVRCLRRRTRCDC